MHCPGDLTLCSAHAAACSMAEACSRQTDSSIKLSPAITVLGHSQLSGLGLHLRSPDPSSALSCGAIILSDSGPCII